MVKKTLQTFKNSSSCFSKIEELNSLYKKKFNKNSPVELFYSRSGDDTKPVFAITAYFDEKDKNEVEFFENLLKG